MFHVSWQVNFRNIMSFWPLCILPLLWLTWMCFPRTKWGGGRLVIFFRVTGRKSASWAYSGGVHKEVCIAEPSKWTSISKSDIQSTSLAKNINFQILRATFRQFRSTIWVSRLRPLLRWLWKLQYSSQIVETEGICLEFSLNFIHSLFTPLFSIKCTPLLPQCWATRILEHWDDCKSQINIGEGKIAQVFQDFWRVL